MEEIFLNCWSLGQDGKEVAREVKECLHYSTTKPTALNFNIKHASPCKSFSHHDHHYTINGFSTGDISGLLFFFPCTLPLMSVGELSIIFLGFHTRVVVGGAKWEDKRDKCLSNKQGNLLQEK